MTESFFFVCCNTQERNLITKFHLSARTLLNYLEHVEDHYRHVPYHNHVHATDVTQSIHSLLSLPCLQVTVTQYTCAVHPNFYQDKSLTEFHKGNIIVS
jgi:hypothetical protein